MQLLKSKTGRVLVEGHRGAESLAPANSWAAILAGVEAGADLIELDIQITADEVPVVYREYRLPDGSWVAATASPILAQMEVGDGRPAPLLSEVLEWAKSQRIGLTLHVANGFGLGVLPYARVVEGVRAAGVAEKVVLAGWDHMGLLWAKRHLPALTTRALIRANPLDLVAMAKRAEVDAVALSYDLADAADVEALHEVGVAVLLADMWEPNFRYVVDLGVDAVSWGDPAEAAYSLQALGAR